VVSHSGILSRKALTYFHEIEDKDRAKLILGVSWFYLFQCLGIGTKGIGGYTFESLKLSEDLIIN